MTTAVTFYGIFIVIDYDQCFFSFENSSFTDWYIILYVKLATILLNDIFDYFVSLILLFSYIF